MLLHMGGKTEEHVETLLYLSDTGNIDWCYPNHIYLLLDSDIIMVASAQKNFSKGGRFP
jgi:hypothetical protein